jgi:hypothetical protein
MITMSTAVEPERGAELRVSYGRREGRGALGSQGPVSHNPAEQIAKPRRAIEVKLYPFPYGPVRTETHRWAKDGRNHAFSVDHMNAMKREVISPECSRGPSSTPQRWAFASELSRSLGEDRDRSKDCPACFRTRPPERRRPLW